MGQPEEQMSVDQGEATLAAAETGHWPDGEELQAYSIDTLVDYPETGTQPAATPESPDSGPRRNWWMLSTAALLAAAAAFVAATAHGVAVLTNPAAPAPVTVTLPAPDRNAEFLADVDRAAIPRDPDGLKAIHNGYVACFMLSTGSTEAEVIDGIIGRGAQATGLPNSQVGPFVRIARAHYCPNGHL
jgi:hypothetical protein